jgi:protein-disulfide isomerase
MSPLAIAVAANDHSIGRDDAPVTLVEYADFQCPYCAAAHGEVTRLLSALPDQVRYVFRHFPLQHIHEFAELGAEAAEAAGAQGKFWDMHDVLFENQQDLSVPGVIAFARALDLDMGRFTADLEARRFQERVERDLRSGQQSGIRGTPSFFLNGEKYEGDYSFDTLVEAIQGGASPAT